MDNQLSGLMLVVTGIAVMKYSGILIDNIFDAQKRTFGIVFSDRIRGIYKKWVAPITATLFMLVGIGVIVLGFV